MTEGGEAIQLSRSVQQNAFMTPAGVAFCHPDNATFFCPHHHQPTGRLTEPSPFVSAHQKLSHSHYMPVDQFVD